jgi:hypothetical protein
MELLSSALILISCVSAGICAVFITRNRTGINKHSRSYIKDMQQDLKYLAESKKQEALEYRKEILRLKGSMNRLKAGPNITESDMESGDIASVLLQKLGLGKYKKFLDPYMPKINQAIAEKKDDIIETIQANNKKAQPGSPNTEETNSL